jgi:hypothetical protein
MRYLEEWKIKFLKLSGAVVVVAENEFSNYTDF